MKNIGNIMNEIKTKRSRLFYRSVILNILWSILNAYVIFSITEQVIANKQSVLIILFVLLLWGYGLYHSIKYTYTLFKITPLISIDNNKIKIHNKDFYFRENPEIKIFNSTPEFGLSKRAFSYIPHQNEACTIQFEREKPIYILDNLYSNAAEIKEFVDKNILKQDYFKKVNSTTASTQTITTGDPITFSGSFPAAIGVPLGFLLSYSLILFCFDIDINMVLGSITLLVLLSFFVLFNSKKYLTYLTITNAQLTVKNYLPFVKPISYNINEIGEIAFENAFLNSRYIRIITTDYKNRLIPLNTFGLGTFRQFVDTVQAYNPDIMIRRKEGIKQAMV